MSNVKVAIEPRDFHRRPLLCWNWLRVICTIRSRIRIRISVCMCVWVGGFYVESKAACVNWCYTSAVSFPNCSRIPRRTRSSTTSRSRSRSRTVSTARIARTSTNARGVSRSRTGTTGSSTCTTSDRTIATANAWGGHRVSLHEGYRAQRGTVGSRRRNRVLQHRAHY